MQFEFFKYQGTGNDFIMIDNRGLIFPAKDHTKIRELCDRRFGIGADGLILLQNHSDYDFEMVYYNSDGHTSSMCGNGGRCIAAFARDLGVAKPELSFLAIDGPHRATIKGDLVSLQMKDVEQVDERQEACVLNTGSPHYITFTGDVESLPVVQNAQKIRYNEEFAKEGINVNFVEFLNNHTIKVRTYERGVEDETYSCGTGVVAAAIAFSKKNRLDTKEIHIKTKGGQLSVAFDYSPETGYTNVWLTGPAEYVFKGLVDI